MAGWIVWCFCGLIFVGLGIHCFVSKKQAGFWANSSQNPEVTDVKAYNRAMGKMWFVYTVIYCLLGLPLRIEGEEGVPYILLISCVGTVISIFGLMLFYVYGIEKKYRKK